MTEFEMVAADAQSSVGNQRMINPIIASLLGWAPDLFDCSFFCTSLPSSALCSSPQTILRWAITFVCIFIVYLFGAMLIPCDPSPWRHAPQLRIRFE